MSDPDSDFCCPHCNRSINVLKDELFDLFVEGCHDVKCPGCDGEFGVDVTSRGFDYDVLADDE